MPVRMTHPDHGITFAVGAEVEWNKKYGWKEDGDNHVDKPVDSRGTFQTIPDKPSIVVSTPAQRYEAKFGKKPHHRMAEKTILKALEG